MAEKILPRAFYNRSPEIVARDLIGKLLVRHFQGQRLSGRISEVEAYLALDDPASHAFTGKTARNAVLFGPPGLAYVYMIYGMHYCLNVSCLPDGVAGGVLFRAIIPMDGVQTMAQLRGLSPTASSKQLTGGPGRLCEAMEITRDNVNNVDFTKSSSALQIRDDGFVPRKILTTARIGLTKAVDRPLRFLLDEGA